MLPSLPSILFNRDGGGERGDLPRKTDEWMLSPPSFFLSVCLSSAPTFGLSIRARDTNSTFFLVMSMNLLKTQKSAENKQKKGGRLETIPSSFAKEKFQTFFYPIFTPNFWVVGMYYEINNLDSSFVDPFLVRSNYIKFFSFVTLSKTVR